MTRLLKLAPATRQLLTDQGRARFTSMIERIRSPRRLLLTLIGVLLGILWIGQAIAGIILRETADPEQLTQWITLSLTGYAIWCVLKAVFQKPVEPFEWTDAEREWLMGAPLARTELIKFRFTRNVQAALFKSTIFTIVMIPDLNLLYLGFASLFIGLILIDLLRIVTEIIVYGLKPGERFRLRLVAFALVGTSFLSAISWATYQSDVVNDLSSAAALGFLFKLLAGFAQQSELWYGVILTMPFGKLAHVALADKLSLQILGILLGSIVLVAFAARVVLRIDTFFLRRRQKIESDNFDNALISNHSRTSDIPTSNRSASTAKGNHRVVASPTRFWGIGPLLWRQWIGARKYRVSMAVALAVPFGLSCLPAFSEATGLAMFMNVVGSLSFYCFLLLPSAFKFDFRRDVTRLAVMKSLPIAPSRIVLGQLALPVLLTTGFQLGVLLATMVINPFPPSFLLVGMAILLPFNFCIFAYENLVFLWYPHRLNQEGVFVFLRSILAFTAKGVMFAMVLMLVLAGLYFSKFLGVYLSPKNPVVAIQIIFTATGCAAMSIAAMLLIGFATRAFRQFDPSCDLAGLD